MSPLNRRQFVYGAGAVLGSTLIGCGKQKTESADSVTTVFVNGTILPVDAGFSEHEALAISGNKILAVGSRADYALTRLFYERMGYHVEASITDFYAPGDAKVIYARQLV